MIQAIKAVIVLDQTALAVRKLRSLNPVNSAVLHLLSVLELRPSERMLFNPYTERRASQTVSISVHPQLIKLI